MYKIIIGLFFLTENFHCFIFKRFEALSDSEPDRDDPAALTARLALHEFLRSHNAVESSWENGSAKLVEIIYCPH